MDPIHLEDDEVDYELWVRQITDLDNAHMRVKTGRLREIFAKETVGVLFAPGAGTSPFPFNVDVEYCTRVCDQIRVTIQDGRTNRSELEALLSRMIHINRRLPRIVTQSVIQTETVQALTTTANGITQMVREHLFFVNRGPIRQNKTIPNPVPPPTPPPHLPAYNRTLNRPSIYDEHKPLARAEAFQNLNDVPLAGAFQQPIRASALPRTPMERASSLQNLATASTPPSNATHTQSNPTQAMPTGPIQLQPIPTQARPTEPIHIQPIQNQGLPTQYLSNLNVPTSGAAVTVTSHTATTTTVTSTTAEPTAFQYRRSTGFWDRTNHGYHQLSHLAPEFFPANRPSVFSDIRSIQSNLQDPLIDFRNNRNIANASANNLPYQNTVRFNPATTTTPRAPNVEFTISDPFNRMESTEGNLFDLMNQQARPKPTAYQHHQPTRTFPYTHNLQNVPIYVDTPYRAAADIDSFRPTENPAATQPFGPYSNRRETNETQTPSQRVYINPLTESPNVMNDPTNYQIVRPEPTHLLPFSHQNRAQITPHHGYTNDHILDREIPQYRPPNRDQNVRYEQHNTRNEIRQPIFARQENNLYRTYVMNPLRGDYPHRTGEIPDHRQNQNDQLDYYNSNALPTATNPPNYPNNHPPRNSYPTQRDFAQSDRNYNKPIPITAWKVYFSGDINLGKDERGVNDFLTLVNIFKTTNLISDDYMLRNVGFLLKKSALNWYLGVLPSLRSWSDFIIRLKTKYLSDNSTFEILSEIENRTQGKNESASAYIEEMVNKFRSMPEPLPEAHQCHIIQRNLSKLNALRLSDKRFKSVIQLEQACRNMESTRKHFKLTSFSDDKSHQYDRYSRPKPVNMVNRELDYPDTEYTVNDSDSDGENSPFFAIENKPQTNRNPTTKSSLQKPFKPNRDFQNNAKPKPENIQNRMRDEKCYNCLQEGHWFGDCTSKISRFFCYRCGKAGAYTPDCTNCNRDATKRNSKPRENANKEKSNVDEEEDADVGTIEISTLFQRLPKDNRPYAKVQIFKTKTLGLLDSGAGVSLLGKKSNIVIPPRYLSAPKDVLSIMTADGTSHEVEAVANLPVTFNGKRKIIEMLVVPGIPKNLILGSNFWETFGIIISVDGDCSFFSGTNRTTENPCN